MKRKSKARIVFTTVITLVLMLVMTSLTVQASVNVGRAINSDRPISGNPWGQSTIVVAPHATHGVPRIETRTRITLGGTQSAGWVARFNANGSNLAGNTQISTPRLIASQRHVVTFTFEWRYRRQGETTLRYLNNMTRHWP